MDPRTQRLAALEPISQVQRAGRWRKNKAMVVGRQQLESTRCQIAAEGFKAGEECDRGESCLLESMAPCYTHPAQRF
jgi:hypothetical protein